METEVIGPKWQAKYERSFPAKIVADVGDIPKSEITQSENKAEGLNPWLIAGIVAIVGVTVYIIWKQNQEAKKREQSNQAQICNNLPGKYPDIQNWNMPD